MDALGAAFSMSHAILPNTIFGRRGVAESVGDFAPNPPSPVSDQLQPSQARMAVSADDDMVMEGDAEGLGRLLDRAGHVDIGARGGRIARRMVVENHERITVDPFQARAMRAFCCSPH